MLETLFLQRKDVFRCCCLQSLNHTSIILHTHLYSKFKQRKTFFKFLQWDSLGMSVDNALNSKNAFIFDKLPYVLRLHVYAKFNYKKFAIFDECSVSSHFFCKSHLSFKFPFWRKTLTIKDDLLQQEELGKSQTWYDTYELKIQDDVTAELCSSIRKNIKAKRITLKLNNALRNFQYFEGTTLECVEIECGTDDNEIPIEFSNVKKIHVNNVAPFSLESVLSIKTKESLCIRKVNVTTEQLAIKLKRWQEGKWSRTSGSRIVIKKMIDFSIERFFNEMKNLNAEPVQKGWKIRKNGGKQEILIIWQYFNHGISISFFDELDFADFTKTFN